jgi:hypothetical protein
VTSKERGSVRREGERLRAARPTRHDAAMYEMVKIVGMTEAITEGFGTRSGKYKNSIVVEILLVEVPHTDLRSWIC